MKKKKFYRGGPNEFRYFWQDVNSKLTRYWKQQYGGESVCAVDAGTPVAYLKAKTNLGYYQDILTENLLPEAPVVISGEYIFHSRTKLAYAIQSL
ncbi:hypothetical protein TNCV_2032381 [Trichonephila clavipes]|nr:hypothetical protein TNCV_2032381 [Trichonephila clavipes]